jgi:four helix bundle protein
MVEKKSRSNFDFRDLEVWKLCRDIRREVWRICSQFPAEEKYRLSDQMIRSSRSATACIAEGYGRFHYQENIQFCRQSRGSLYELIDHFLTAMECEYLKQGVTDEMINKIKNAIMALNGYLRFLKNKKQQPN